MAETKIDPEIRHVTPPGSNLFLELGFPPDEAELLHADSQQRIKAALLLKEQLMGELSADVTQPLIFATHHKPFGWP